MSFLPTLQAVLTCPAPHSINMNWKNTLNCCEQIHTRVVFSTQVKGKLPMSLGPAASTAQRHNPAQAVLRQRTSGWASLKGVQLVQSDPVLDRFHYIHANTTLQDSHATPYSPAAQAPNSSVSHHLPRLLCAIPIPAPILNPIP